MHPLAAYIQRNDINRARLAKELDVSRTTITRWLEGSRKIGDREVEKVSAITGIPVKELRPDLAKLLLGADQ